TAPIPVPRPWQYGDDRAQRGSGRCLWLATGGVRGLAGLGRDPCPESDRLPQPGARRAAVALVVSDVSTGRTTDHRPDRGVGRVPAPLAIAARQAGCDNDVTTSA